MDVMELRRRLLMSQVKKSRLPAEYQEVAYLELPSDLDSSVYPYHAFLLTGVDGNLKTIEINYEKKSTTINGPIIVASYNRPETPTPQPPWAAIDGRYSFAQISPIATELDVPTVYTVVYESTNNPIRIGGWSDTAWTAVGRYYYVKIFDGSQLIFNGVPCYRKSDNKTGMYDRASESFIPNAGTSEFVLGPNV